MNSFSSFSNRASASQLKTRQQLEKLWRVSSPLPQPALETPALETPWYKHLGQWLVQGLTNSEQVRVWTKITPNGMQWCAYDPQRDRRFSGYSEADLRTWLEQRYS